jgi:hypothetical protein
MDKLSNYIPLIIIIVSVIISIAGKGKKNVVGHETTLPGKKPGEILPEEVKKPRQSKKAVVTSNQPMISQKYHSKQVSEQQTSAPEVEEEPSTPFLDTSDMDEVKKAIIYAEIFSPLKN